MTFFDVFENNNDVYELEYQKDSPSYIIIAISIYLGYLLSRHFCSVFFKKFETNKDEEDSSGLSDDSKTLSDNDSDVNDD